LAGNTVRGSSGGRKTQRERERETDRERERERGEREQTLFLIHTDHYP